MTTQRPSPKTRPSRPRNDRSRKSCTPGAAIRAGLCALACVTLLVPAVLAQPPGTTDDARILTHTLPVWMECGASGTYSITLLNSGTSTWTREDGVKLGAPDPQEPFRSTFRIQLPAGVEVEPGAQYTFDVHLDAPTTADAYATTWKMVRESVHWFGGLLQQPITVGCQAWPQQPASRVLAVDRQASNQFFHRSLFDATRWDQLGPPQLTVPSRAGLVATAQGFELTPSAGFRAAGGDAFHYSWDPAGEGWTTVSLVDDLRDDFDPGLGIVGCLPAPGWSLVGDMNTVTTEAGSGPEPCRLLFDLGTSQEAALLSPTVETGPGGGNTTLSIDVGGNTPPNGFSFTGELSVAAGWADSEVVFEIALLPGPEVFVRGTQNDSSTVISASAPLAWGTNEVRLDWWFGSASGFSPAGGAFLTVNGEIVARINGLDNDELVPEESLFWEIGVTSVPVSGEGYLKLHSPKIWTSLRQPIYEPIFADPGNLPAAEAWSTVTQPEHMGVVVDPVTGNGVRTLSAKAMTGGPSLATVLSEGQGRLATEVTFDPGGLAASSPGAFWELVRGVAFDGSGAPLSAFSLEARRTSNPGEFEIRALSEAPLHTVSTAWQTLVIPGTGPTVRLYWSTASLVDGGGTLRVHNGSQDVLELTGLANDGMEVEEVEVGLLRPSFLLQGNLLLDHVFLWR